MTSASTMKEAVVAKGPKVTIQDVPIPRAGPGQVVTKVVYSGSNPKDWKRAAMPDTQPKNQGDDISGVVHEVGENVSEFKPEGAAIPLAALTAAVGLFARLQLPVPFLPRPKDSEPLPLIIYGAASAVGSYALQLASRANIHPLLCIAGNGAAHVEKYIDRSKGDTIIDYRKGNDALVKALKEAAQGKKLEYAFDAVSEKGSVENLGQVLDQEKGQVTFVLPGKKYDLPGKIKQSLTTVGSVHGFPDDLKDFGYVYFRYIAKGLQEGWFKPQPQEVIPGGLQGIERGLRNLKEGKASAVKYVFKIEDTPGLDR
ncbi:Trans-enoyl reductase fsr4 [Pseudocercospora fuligena]|uniref:Trans-enoyl reductase fsr4 n=1 Tax=Pseudocercospora fuligena TaxID=685502 RepID=A0A8H6RGW0_9PEZI|nr:Trans-enoyl reductase fsr4 [Pseudocercospora fuligena]